jgi:Putative peptidoglycan binding domain
MARAATAALSLACRALAKALRRPVDSVAIIAAGAASIAILVNALFLQSGSHPAPFFANPTRQPTAAARPKPEAASRTLEPAPSVHSTGTTRALQTVAARRNDPIAEFIGSSARIMAVQRVLSEFGYGQIKPSGFIDNATSAAIEKFEREHKLPVTGRVSDRLVSDLAAMTGRPLN